MREPSRTSAGAERPRGRGARRMAGPLVVAALSVVLGSCVMGPDYRRPDVATPAAFRDETPTAASIADLGWWDVFHDDALAALLREAIAGNQDLEAALARVEQARTSAGVAAADLFPQVEGTLDASRSGSSRATAFAFGPSTSSDYRAAVSVTWELDLWGRVRRGREAALADYLASREGRCAAVVTLVGDVSEAYFNLLDLDLELEIARTTHETRRHTSDLFAARHASGASSALEAAQATADLAVAAAAVPSVELRIAQQENALSLLLGRNPGRIARGSTQGLCAPPPTVPAGIPACLLERRPDVLEAEAELMAANARVGVAQAERFPTISLTGLLGVESDDLSHLTTAKAGIDSVGASMTAPLFQGGRLTASRRLAVARWHEAVAKYRRAAQDAFRDVADQLVAVRKLRDVRTELEKQVGALREALALLSSNYDNGLSAYFEVLDAQRRLFPAEIDLARVRRDQCLALVRLYRALGGGWRDRCSCEAGR